MRERIEGQIQAAQKRVEELRELIERAQQAVQELAALRGAIEAWEYVLEEMGDAEQQLDSGDTDSRE